MLRRGRQPYSGERQIFATFEKLHYNCSELYVQLRPDFQAYFSLKMGGCNVADSVCTVGAANKMGAVSLSRQNPSDLFGLIAKVSSVHCPRADLH